MQRKNQYFPAVASFPGTAPAFKAVSASEITKTAPGGAKQRYGDGGDRRRYEAQQQRHVPGAIETSAVQIRDVSSRPGQLLAPAFLRAALLAHLRRTFR
jgi:hypothetical protein